MQKSRLVRKVLFMLIVCISAQVYAQSTTSYHFFVQFHDKALNYVDINAPDSFLSDRALERRKRLNIPVDSLDLPVTLAYINNIRKPSIQVRYVSKWLNGAVISTHSMDTAWRLKIKFFVDDVVYLGKSIEQTRKSGTQGETVPSDEAFKKQYGDGFRQLDMLQGTALHKYGFKGEGMKIAVFDAGFRKVNSLSLFAPLFHNNQISYTTDLVDLETNVYDDDDHGLHVFGCIAANKPSTMIGAAPNADFVLIRTESNKYETWLEELNWVRAAEIADSLGVDVINSSLGYNHFDEARLNHKHSDLDGKTTYISRGAAIAATRGMLVVNSAGNDGNKSWGKLDFPADVEDILVVGAVDHSLEAPAFSSPGPTADFRIKPDVAALGKQTFIATTYGIGTGYGTSYSSPIIAGLATCLWQANPTLTPIEVKEIIKLSGHLYYNPDNVMGYGTPDFDLALTMTGKHPNFDYSKPQILSVESKEFKHEESFNLYAADHKTGYCEVKQKKRFLFFSYYKKRYTAETSLTTNGFGRLHILLYNIPNGKEVTLSFYGIDADGHKTEIKEIKGRLGD